MTEPARRSLRTPISRWTWVLPGLCFVLSGIGFVQLRWIEQVAKAQRERALGAIQAGVARFASAFDGEITRVHLAFETPSPSSDAAAVLRHRFTMWREMAPYPRLVSEVKLVEVPRAPGFFHFSARPGFFGQPRPESGSVIGPGPDLVDMPGGRNVALIVPVIAGHGSMAAGESGGVDILPPSAAHSAQIVLDMNYIEREFIPEVINRAFAEQKADLQILIVSNADPNRVIWRSEPNGEAARRSADLSAAFFTLRPECFMDAMGAGTPGTARPGSIPAGEAGLRQIMDGRMPRCEQQPPGGRPDGNWRIYVRYGAGSVDAVVTRFRYWSIGLSLAVLLILFLAGLMLVLSTERARSLAKVQMEFAAAVSHELRTPLSAIRIAADNLSQGMVENRAQAERYGSLIGAQVQHLTSLVSDVLLFSHAEASPEIPGVGAVGVEAVVEDALSNCAADLSAAGFRVERDLRTPLPEILASRHLITQCLINVIQNATKYARSGKFIGVHASACSAGSLPGVQIEIADHGPGIPRDELSRIFQPFYRGRQARSSQTSGLGLGLSIVKRIVDGHGGRIDVHSEPNSQTRFSIWIPAASCENAAER